MTADQLTEAILVGAKLTKADAGRDLDLAIETLHSNKRLIASVASLWNQISAEDQQTWIDGAVGFPAKNRYGDIYTPSGYQVFMKLNMNLGLINEPMLSVCPIPNFPVLPDVESPSADIPELLSFYFVNGIPDAQAILVYACTQVQRGSSFKKGKEKLLGICKNNTSGVIDTTYAYQNLFGRVKSNAMIFYRLVPISKVTGQNGVDLTVKVQKPSITYIPKLSTFLAGVNEQAVPVGKNWIVPFRIMGFNLTDVVSVAVADPSLADVRIGLTKTGPWITEFDVPLNQVSQPSQNVLYLNIHAAAVGPLNTYLQISSPGADTILFNVAFVAFDQVLEIDPDPVVFGNVYRGVYTPMELDLHAVALRANINVSLGGPDADRFELAASLDGPWGPVLECPPPKYTKVHSPTYCRVKPGDAGSLTANVNVTCGPDFNFTINGTAVAIDGAITSDNSPGDDFGDQGIGVPLYPDFSFDCIGAAGSVVISKSALVNSTVQFSESILGPWFDSLSIAPVAGVINTKQIFMKITAVAAGAASFSVDFAAPSCSSLQLDYDLNGV